MGLIILCLTDIGSNYKSEFMNIMLGSINLDISISFDLEHVLREYFIEEWCSK
jgi:hypothetical protein